MVANEPREQLDAVAAWLAETCRACAIAAPIYDEELKLYSFEINHGDVATLAVDEDWLESHKADEIAAAFDKARVSRGVLRACGDDHIIWVSHDGYVVKAKP